MVYIQAIALVYLTFTYKSAASLVALHDPILVNLVIAVVHCVYLLWRAMRRRITDRASRSE